MAIHKVYANLSGREKCIADEAFIEVAACINAYGKKAAMDDRAERLVEAIAVYMTESNREMKEEP